MNCRRVNDSLVERYAGALPRPAERAVDDHLSRCPECWAAYHELVDIVHMSRSAMDSGDDADSIECILSRVRESEPAVFTREIPQRITFRELVGAFAVLGVVLPILLIASSAVVQAFEKIPDPAVYRTTDGAEPRWHYRNVDPSVVDGDF